MKKGVFITLHGINNIGKSTHAKLLVERLKTEGYDAVYLKYPIYELEPTGPKINSILRDPNGQTVSEEELQTLFMQNRRDFEPSLMGMLEAGKIVIAEDYIETGITWGVAKGLDEKWVEDLNADLLKPDFYILMVGERDLASQEKSHIHENDDELIGKVDELLKRRAKEGSWVIVELQPEIVDTAELMWETTLKILLQASN